MAFYSPFMVKCKQIKIVEKTVRLEFATHKQYKIQKQTLRVVLQKKPFDKKSLLNCSSSGNVVKILENNLGIHL